MPSRKRTNLSRSTADARRKRLLRASETQTQREKRLCTQRERTSLYRASETEEQKAERREADRRRKARQVAAQREQLRVANRKRLELLRGTDHRGEPEGGTNLEDDDDMRNSRVGAAEEASVPREGEGTPLGGAGKRRRRAREREEEVPGKRKGIPPPGNAPARQSGRRRLRRGAGEGGKEEQPCSGVGDPEVFIKRAVRQWLDKVKRQVNVACSRVTIKSEIGEDEMSLNDSFTVEEATVTKTEPVEDVSDATEESQYIIPDPILKPVKAFTNVAGDVGLASRTAVVPEESDPLGVDGELKPTALITFLEGGVLREENYSTSCPASNNVIVLKEVKEEFDSGALETSPSSVSGGSSVGGGSKVLEKN